MAINLTIQKNWYKILWHNKFLIISNPDSVFAHTSKAFSQLNKTGLVVILTVLKDWWRYFCLAVSNWVCTLEAFDLSRCKARKLFDWSCLYPKSISYSHYWLWISKGICWPGNKEAYSLQRTQKSDRDSSLHEHQHSLRKRFVNLKLIIINVLYCINYACKICLK